MLSLISFIVAHRTFLAAWQSFKMILDAVLTMCFGVSFCFHELNSGTFLGRVKLDSSVNPTSFPGSTVYSEGGQDGTLGTRLINLSL